MTEHVNKIMEKLINILRLLRVSHWTKAVFVMIGFCYTPIPGFFSSALLASVAFCLISSAVYIYNDLEDKEEDCLHPYKRYRPLACKEVSIVEALVLLFLLLISGLTLGWFISRKLAFILSIYLAINISYNHFFKVVPIMDVLCIAAGFMLRVLAGTLGIGLPISVWLIVAATLLSLFIALNKRQMEMHLDIKKTTRKVLKKYNPVVLQGLIIGVGILCFINYILYIFIVRKQSFYFILTVPFAAIALWRFSWLSRQNIENDDPIIVFLNDKLSRINLWCFVILTFMALA